MKEIDKQLAKEIKEHDLENIEERFSDLIREEMTDKQFWKWIATWKDTYTLCDEAEDWFLSLTDKEQEEEFKNAKKFIK